MTIALAQADNAGIHLAAESFGLDQMPLQSMQGGTKRVLDSKVLSLQAKPPLALAIAGGLDHWAYVKWQHESQVDIHRAAAAIATLLDNCMTEENQAYGLLCGYEAGTPICYRINRPCDKHSTDLTLEDVRSTVQPLGHPKYAAAAREHALKKIKFGMPSLPAMVEGIENQIPSPVTKWPVTQCTLLASE